MVSNISLDDRNAWDDSALIDSWDEALAEYKVSLLESLCMCKANLGIEILQYSSTRQTP